MKQDNWEELEYVEYEEEQEYEEREYKEWREYEEWRDSQTGVIIRRYLKAFDDNE